MRHRRVGKWPARYSWAQGHIASQGCSKGCAVLKGATEDPLTCTATTMELKPACFASVFTGALATSHVCAQKRPLKRAVASPFTRNFAALQRPGPALPRGAARRARRLPASLHPGRGLSLHHGRDAAQQRLWESPTKRKRQAAAGRDAAGLLALFCHTSESRARDDGLLSMYIMGGPLLRLVIDLVPASFEFPGTVERKIPRL